MNYRYAVAAAVAVGILGITALAQNQTQEGRVCLLKSGGKVVAELRVLNGASFSIVADGGSANYYVATGKIVATGGAILILTTGTNSISVRADGIESLPASLAVENQSETGAMRPVRLKSNGETLAEMRVPRDAELSVSGKNNLLYTKNGQATAKGAITIKMQPAGEIQPAGGPPVAVKADEILIMPNGQ